MTGDTPQGGEAPEAENAKAREAAGDFDETSVPGLWETVRWFMRWLVAVCGEPCDVLGLGKLTLKDRRGILRWLRPVEGLVRRLLVAEAAEIAADLPIAPGKPGGKRRPRPPMRRVAFQTPENSEQWTVRFQLAGRAGHKRAGRRSARRGWGVRPPAPGRAGNFFERFRRQMERQWIKENRSRTPNAALPPEPALTGAEAPGSKPAALFNPLPLAERIEAVWRVLENREPCVKRLARRLARRRSAFIERLLRACRPPPERSPYARKRYGETPLRHASSRALEALASFDTG